MLDKNLLNDDDDDDTPLHC